MVDIIYMTLKYNSRLREKLQRDMDLMTERLAHEEKELTSLTEQIFLTKKELDHSKSRLDSSKAQAKREIKDVERMVKLEHKRTNYEFNFNQQLIHAINVHRMEMNHCKKTMHEMNSQIRDINLSLEDKKKSISTGRLSNNRLKYRILQLTTRQSTERKEFSFNLKKINSFIQEEKSKRIGGYKNSRESSNPLVNPMIANTTKNMKRRWARKLREKKNSLEKYVESVRVLDQAFEQISQDLGTKDYSKVVEAVINSEDEFYKFSEYLNLLGNEIDLYSESVEHTSKMISSLMDSNEVQEATKNDRISQLESKKLEVEDELSMQNLKMKLIWKSFGDIEEDVCKINDAFQWVEKLQIPKFNSEEGINIGISRLEYLFSTLRVICADKLNLDTAEAPGTSYKHNLENISPVDIITDEDLDGNNYFEFTKPCSVDEFRSNASFLVNTLPLRTSVIGPKSFKNYF